MVYSVTTVVMVKLDFIQVFYSVSWLLAVYVFLKS